MTDKEMFRELLDNLKIEYSSICFDDGEDFDNIILMDNGYELIFDNFGNFEEIVK